MSYTTYTAEDFVLDESFRQWVKQPDADSSRFWTEWLAQHPEKAATVEQARRMLLAIDFRKTPPAEIDHQGMWRKIQENIRKEPRSTAFTIRRNGASRRLFHSWQKIAAAVTLLIAASVAAYLAWQPAPAVTHATPYGQQKIIPLPDGSVVTLNANSTLTFNAPWNADAPREVWLQGEAFFEVKKHLQQAASSKASAYRRFVVHTNDLDITVLGTAFNVNHRRGNTRVVLNSGKVTLHQPNAPDAQAPVVVMAPAELAEYTSDHRKLVKRKVNPGQYSSWVNQRLVFNETPLREIAQTLEDTYGWRVVFADAQLADRTFTGSAPTGNMSLLLTAIAQSFRLNVTRTDNQIVLQRK